MNYKKHNNSLQTSLHLFDGGLLPIPLAYNAKVPRAGFELQTYLSTSHERSDIEHTFKDHVGNIGVACGHNNLVVVDFDSWQTWALCIGKTYPSLLKTRWVKTRRGVHVYYFIENMPDSTYNIADKIDVKCSGYVVAPPSTVAGHEYEIFNNDQILTIDTIEYLALERFEVVSKQTTPHKKNVGSVGSNGRYKSEKHRLIHEIKDRMTVIDALGHFGDGIHIPKNSEKNYVSLRCPHPLHEDRHPSFQYFFKDERVYCNTSGCEFNKKHQFDQIDVYRIMNDNLALDQALYELGQHYGLDVGFLE